MPDYATAIDIRATAEEVFDYLVTSEGLTTWMGEHAVLEPIEGGLFQVDIAGTPIRGRFLEVTRPERVVVSWGVAGSTDLPPGSTTVSFTLTPVENGTRVELLHRDLPNTYADGHAEGWGHFLPRLATAAEGLAPADDSEWVPLPRRR
ncbi:SRPBCC domain-containing protein [Leifsonia sp. NPDC058230]|uniref:SRPBCC family protein n=1 Tax=Leifsonia sp. NPDC058230 TaxID=3346391 RepID=UPI0036DF0BCE